VKLADVTRRPETDGDAGFLLDLYRSSREQELALVDWSDDQKRAFIAMQFKAQRDHYRREYPGAHYDVLERLGEPIGRLYVHERADEVRVMDITLSSNVRGQGLGGALLGQILDEAAESGRTVSIHVERFNPALRLYERLGFRPVDGQTHDSIYLLLEVRP